MRTKRLISSLLMAAGIVLVFYGFNSALGFTVIGMIASVAAIVSLLYAGGVLFGAAPERTHDSAVAEDAVESDKRRAVDARSS
jgi:hypothetical protein